MYRHTLLKIVAIATLSFLFVPLLLIMVTAFNSGDTISIFIDGFSLRWFFKVFKSRSLVNALKFSLKLGLLSAVLGVVIGIFASIALTRRPGKVSNALLNLFLSSSLIPGVVMGYVLFQCIVVTLQIPLAYALMIGHILIVLPYSIRLISAGLKNCDVSIEEAARTLGCRPVMAFLLVVLPDLKGAILSAFMMGFINSFNNIPVSMYLKGPGMNTLPYAMMSYIEYTFDPTVSALSVMIMLFTLFCMIAIDRIAGKRSR